MAHFPEDFPEHARALAAALGIRPEDIEEFHTHGHGHGGMKINKSLNCVELTHHPTGITVRYQHHRGLRRNRREAYGLLISKVEERVREEESARARERFRVRKQKRRRSQRAKEKMLREKKFRGGIKENRREVQ